VADTGRMDRLALLEN
jgi:hypothetical protein